MTTTLSPALDARPSPGLASIFGATLRSEWTKFRSVRSSVWTLLAAVVATIGLGAALCAAYVSRYDQLSIGERLRFDPMSFNLRGLFLAQLAIGVLGVMVISSEYTTGMIRTSFAAVPQRRTVIAAKSLVFVVVAFVVGTAACLGAFFAGQALLASKHLNVGLGDPGVVRAILGGGAYLAIIGLLGLALGTLLRRTAGAIAALFGLVLVLPALASALPSPWGTDVPKYLPSEAGQAMFGVHHHADLLSPGAGFAVLVGYAVVAGALALVAVARRDA
jgi:ABC-type transport system involved in multi-copper enzyme maturation permease subunit